MNIKALKSLITILFSKNMYNSIAIIFGEIKNLVMIIIRMVFIEHFVLAGFFLLLASPYILCLSVISKLDIPKLKMIKQKEKTSPFVYTMQ